MSFTSKVLHSWEAIEKYLKLHVKHTWIYRGQKFAEWPLSSSLERCCERENITPGKRLKLERELTRDFTRSYHQYAEHIPEPDSPIEWISIMRHHGAPTRLLDFTYSFYVALYFAVEDAGDSDDYAVWAVNMSWAMLQSISRFKRLGKKRTSLLLEPTTEKHEIVYRKLLFEAPFAKTVVPLSPFGMSQRLRTQRATFLAPGEVSCSFKENLLALPGHQRPDNLVKILIPRDFRVAAIERLYAMNISRTSLFPGLDGYAQSLGIFHPAFRPDRFDRFRRKRQR
jgi:hypothetical protein